MGPRAGAAVMEVRVGNERAGGSGGGGKAINWRRTR